MKRNPSIASSLFFQVALAVIALAGPACSLRTFDPTLTATIDGLTLESLKEIQDDQTLTDDEKRIKIREAIGAPDTVETDRLVDFLLGLNIP
jgi:hypothetical protein